MCGRYWIESEADAEMMRIIQAINRTDVKTAGEIFPGDRVPVVCRSRAGRIRPFAMEWGYRMDGGRRIINARSETAGEKPMFRESMRLRRCLLPMSAYFEWEQTPSGKQRHRIAPREQGLHFLAGLYRFEADAPVCTVLTAAAAREIAFIHPRMPVILDGGSAGAWLEGGNIDFSCSLPLVHAPQ